MADHTVYLTELSGLSIHEQLLLEEELLRTDEQNRCLINVGSPPRIVMGISGKPEEHIRREPMEREPLPITRRYSGGGTVVVDEDTLFVSFIFNKSIHPFHCYPEPILRWSEKLYRGALSVPGFRLRENDYVIGDRKCGGNAQYIRKKRFVHHTSFLWDFDPEKMAYLLYPPGAPAYRSGRTHDRFVCSLKDHVASRDTFTKGVVRELGKRYRVVRTPLGVIDPFMARASRQTSRTITYR